MKPSPLDIQDMYLASLVSLGIDPAYHDIRFVEDDWESPTLGAWGLGWEVWLDGMEITQFTYFQQVGGIDLSPITVEITYGIERIAMYLQDVDNVFAISNGTTRSSTGTSTLSRSGSIPPTTSRRRTRDMLRSLFDSFEAEGERLAQGKGARLSRLRFLPEVLPRLQHARRAGGLKRDGADQLHRPGQEPRQDVRRAVRAERGKRWAFPSQLEGVKP